VPLGYLLIQSNIREPRAKKIPLVQFIDFINKHWHLHVVVTLMDKDWSKINAFLDTIPDAKHQLCFWHALRAIKTCLSTLQHAPAHYNVKAAMAEFSWINELFVLIGQSTNPMSHTTFITAILHSHVLKY